MHTIVSRTLVIIASMMVPHGREPARHRKLISPETALGRFWGRFSDSSDLAARSGYHQTYIGQLERGEKVRLWERRPTLRLP